jgi:hypothetical protein
MPREKDNREVRQGVQLYDAGTSTVVTLTDPDEIEERLTPDQCDRLLAQGAISGDWSPRGEGEPPMPRSKAARGTRIESADAAHAADEVLAQNATLRRQLAARDRELRELREAGGTAGAADEPEKPKRQRQRKKADAPDADAPDAPDEDGVGGEGAEGGTPRE